MRYLPILGLVLFSLASCSTKEGKVVEPRMTLDSLLRLDRTYLETYFGADNIRDTVIGQKNVSMLYPGSTREVRLFWYDERRVTIEEAETGPKRDTVGYWQTRDSIHVGMRIKEIEKKNDVPFYLSNADHRVSADFLKDGKIPAGVTLFFDPYNIVQHYGRKSTDEVIASVNPRVIGIRINKMCLPPTMGIRWVQVVKDGYNYPIPQVIDRNPSRKIIVDEMNLEIRRTLDVQTLDLEGKDTVVVTGYTDIGWNDGDLFVFPSFSGVYLGMRYHGMHTIRNVKKYRSAYLFFDMASGKTIDHTMVPLHALFKPEKYWEFMDKYWTQEFYKRYRAGECTGELSIPTACLSSSINFEITDKMVLKLFSNDVHCSMCMDEMGVDIPYSELKPYLTKWGMGLIWQEEFGSKSPHNQMDILNSKYKAIAPDNLFVRFAGEYDTTSIALEFYEGDSWSDDDPDSVKAINRNRIKGTINWGEGHRLDGYFDDWGMIIDVVNNEGSSKFEFLWANDGDENSIALDSTFVICNEIAYDGSKTPRKILHFTFSRPDSPAAGKAYIKWQ